MRSSSKKFAAVLVTVVLSSTLATPVFAAAQRDDSPRDRGSRVVRVVKQLLKHFGIRSNEEIAVPKP
jgi:hypothetical protein